MTFHTEAPSHTEAWINLVKSISKANKLDQKTTALSYLAVPAALGLESGIPFHSIEAKKAEATRDEVMSAISLGLPAAGNVVIKSLPLALSEYDVC